MFRHPFVCWPPLRPAQSSKSLRRRERTGAQRETRPLTARPKASLHKSETLDKTFDTGASSVLSTAKSPDRAVAAQPATAGKPGAAAGWQASFVALLRVRVFIHPSKLNQVMSWMPSRSGERTRARVHALSPDRVDGPWGRSGRDGGRCRLNTSSPHLRSR